MKHLVISVHGINTFGNWQERLETLLANAPAAADRVVYNYKYGWFSIFAFLVPFMRWLIVRRFRSFLIEKTRHDSWDRIDLICHSFGTHIVGWGLYGLPPRAAFKVHTVILSGSVLKSDFPWDHLIDGRVGRVINDCGTRDNVLWLSQIVVLFTGMAGRLGFNGGTGRTLRNRYFPYRHSGYFLTNGASDDTFMKQYWLPLLLTEDEPQLVDLREKNPFNWLEMILLNNLEPIKLIVYVTPVVLAALVINQWRVQAIVQRDRAEAMLAAGEQTATSLISDLALRFRDQIGIPGELVVRLFGQARTLAEQLSLNSTDNSDLTRTRASALADLSSAQRVQGDPKAAADTARAAISGFDALSRLGPSREGMNGKAVAFDRLGDALLDQCMRPEAASAYRSALALAQQLAKGDGATPMERQNLATAREKLGDIARLDGSNEEALKWYEASFGERRTLVAETPGQLAFERDLAVSYEKLADVQLDLGRSEDARESFSRSAAIADRIRKLQPQSATGLRDANVAAQETADLLKISGSAEAMELYAKELASTQYLAGLDPGRLAWQRDLFSSMMRFGDALADQQKIPEAAAIYRSAAAVAERLVKASPACRDWRHGLAVVDQKLGEALEAQEPGSEEALEKYQRSLELRKVLADDPGSRPKWRLEFAQVYLRIAEHALSRGRPDMAVEIIRDQVDFERKRSAVESGKWLADALGNLAWYALLARDTDLSLSGAEEAIGIAPQLAWVHANRAYALMFAGRTEQARTELAQFKTLRGEQWDKDVASDFSTFEKRGLGDLLTDQFRQAFRD
jgi:tetratricopeptide (TPR) repeat protein